MYAKATLFDYSYRFFYGDGYGKDYHILNLDEGTERRQLEPYLTACLLAFFEQQRLHRVTGESLKKFNIAKPLLIFVGGSVNAVRTQNKRQVSDVTEVLLVLASFLANPDESARRIEETLKKGLISADGWNIFTGLFRHLHRIELSGREIYREMLVSLFNAEGGGALHVDYLKGQDGEIALRVGDNDPFAVINVGDAKKLADLCDTYKELHVQESEFGESLFAGLNDADSRVHMLIGSKKFTEGWNSWRVSTMGLMNIGSTEGSQIIQLFGRGVRLKGWQNCLRRSSHADLPMEMCRPDDLGLLETLNIFGVKADYMAEFRKYLEEEGLPPNEQPHEILLPVLKTKWSKPLKTLKLKEKINGVSTRFGDPFKRFGPIPTLQVPSADPMSRERYLFDHRVTLNWYPRVKAVRARGIAVEDDHTQLNSTKLTKGHIALLDLDAIYFELLRFKAERGWNNLNITRSGIRELLANGDWYDLQIPASEMAFDSFERVRLWQEISISLLKKYCERYYTFRKREWELPHLEYQLLSCEDPNFAGYSNDDEEHFYRVLVDQSREDIIADIERLKEAIESKDLAQAQFGPVSVLWFDQHLYEPLLHLSGGGEVVIKPTSLNGGERGFVESLRQYWVSHGEDHADHELYLLRNRSQGGGVGFFEAGNFHPDFMLWIAEGDSQRIVFIDPKGLLNVGPDDPKVRFYDTIKEIENRLADEAVTLDSFIISTTPAALVRNRWGKSDSWLADHHILFPESDQDFVGRLLVSPQPTVS